MNTAELQPVGRVDIRLGQPVAFSIYDRSGRLLLAAGQIVREEKALSALLRDGVHANPRWSELDITELVEAPAKDDRPAPVFGSMPREEAPRRKRPHAPWRLLQMWSESGSAEDALSVKLIGVHEGKSLLISAPERDGRLAFVKEGNLYRFRGFSGDAVYDFTACLLKVCFEPYPYLHVSWPHSSQVVRQPLRGARRVGCELPCIVYPQPKGAEFIKGIVADLSATGASIRLIESLPNSVSGSGRRVRVVFRLAVAGEQVLFDALAKPVRTPALGDDTSLGVVFGSLLPKQRLALHAFVYAAIARELETPLYAEL